MSVRDASLICRLLWLVDIIVSYNDLAFEVVDIF